MIGEPFQTGVVINLANNEVTIDAPLQGLPGDKLFIVEFVGINAFTQPGQHLFVALQVTTKSIPGIYPIVPAGVSTISDPTYPARVFGSQQVKLYSDPGSEIIITVARSDGSGDARAFVDISGRIVLPSPAIPQNLRVT